MAPAAGAEHAQHGPEEDARVFAAGAVHRTRVRRDVCGRRGRFGLGLGHLSHLLAFHHGLKVVGLEASEANAAGAAIAPSACSPRCVPAASCRRRGDVRAATADETDVAEADGEGAAAHVASVSDGASGGSFVGRWRLPVDTGRAALPIRCGRRAQRRLVLVGLHAWRPAADAAALLRRGRRRRRRGGRRRRVGCCYHRVTRRGCRCRRRCARRRARRRPPPTPLRCRRRRSASRRAT